MQLMLLLYNNYLNRLFKIETSIQDYYDNARDYFTIDDFDFNPADGVDTVITIGGEDYDYKNADYLLVTDDNLIISRWFIVDANRVRYGLYKVSLHRDVIADGYDIWSNSPAFIEKGYISSIDNPAIFMQEDFGANKIKKSEVPLYDKSGSPWICVFFKDGAAKSNNTTLKVPIGFSNETVTNIDNYWLQPLTATAGETAILHTCNINSGSSCYNFIVSSTGTTSHTSTSAKTNVPTMIFSMASFDVVESQTKNNYIAPYNSMQNANGAMVLYAQSKDANHKTTSEINSILAANGIIVYDSTSTKYWKYNVNLTRKVKTIKIDDGTTFNALRNSFNTGFSYLPDPTIAPISASDTNTFDFNYSYNEYVVTRTEVSDIELSISDITGGTQGQTSYPILSDAPYGMIFMPLEGVEVTDGAQTYTAIKDIQLAAYEFLSRHLSTSYGLDAMILPYCPEPNLIGEGTFNATPLVKIRFTDSLSVIRGGLYFAKFSTFKGIIPYEITVPEDPIEFKLQNETLQYRLCSTGYASAFEFSPLKNYGVDYFNYSCTYKPYQPYIRVSPNFKGLYGLQFDDNRGLIVSGDFTLPQVTDAWRDYQVNNKNYKDSFDRQLSNMNVQRKYQRIEQIAGSVSGAFGVGATAGVVGGPGVGIFAGVASLAAGAADAFWISEQLFKENKSFSKDMFNFNLENIQALPIGLTKSSGWNADSDYVPFLEIYGPTDEEQEAFRKLIVYNGMTVNRYGKAQDYKGGYVKGTIVRMEGLMEDYHFANTIRNEFKTGVYIL